MESGQTARAASLQLGREERWAHAITQPERGCLLVARPRPGLGMFANTVILLLEHENGEGSSGLVINMPTPLLISNLGLEEEVAGEEWRHPAAWLPANRAGSHLHSSRGSLRGQGLVGAAAPWNVCVVGGL
jgi:hypothetical protein